MCSASVSSPANWSATYTRRPRKPRKVNDSSRPAPSWWKPSSSPPARSMSSFSMPSCRSRVSSSRLQALRSRVVASSERLGQGETEVLRSRGPAAERCRRSRPGPAHPQAGQGGRDRTEPGRCRAAQRRSGRASRPRPGESGGWRSAECHTATWRTGLGGSPPTPPAAPASPDSAGRCAGSARRRPRRIVPVPAGTGPRRHHRPRGRGSAAESRAGCRGALPPCDRVAGRGAAGARRCRSGRWISASPRVGRIMAMSRRIVVVLPAPAGPRKPKT